MSNNNNNDNNNEEKVVYPQLWVNNILNNNAKWLNKKPNIKLTSNNNELILEMNDKCDFWKKTYYTPLLDIDNGYYLYLPMINNFRINCHFTLHGIHTFDQAGVMLRVDDQHWIKAGIEMVDKKPKLSVVVTNEYSDWSTQEWSSFELSLRVYKFNCDIVVEALIDNKWNFIRIAHLHIDENAIVNAGIMAAAPTKAGGSVIFHSCVIEEAKGFTHTNNIDE